MDKINTFGRIFKSVAFTLVCTSVSLMADVTIALPVGIAADATRVLVTGPACNDPMHPRGVYDITSGAPVLFQPLPFEPGCTENYIAIAPGFGGFTAGDVFVTSGNNIFKITGGALPPPAPFATVGASGTHSGISFDGVGTFGFNMIVSGENGHLFLIDHTGTLTKDIVPTLAAGSGVQLESPRVAPLTFGPFGGYLWATGEASSALYAISPLDSSTVKLPATFPGGPESLTFLPSSVCSVKVGGVAQSFFDALIFANTVKSFDVTAFANKALVNEEYSGLIDFIGTDGNLVLPRFQSGLGVQEGTAIVTARTDTPSCPLPLGCTLTQGGYKNHFNSKLLNLPTGGLTLGTVFYTNTQLNQILQNNAVGGNGLISLAHQLITAELNIFYGAMPPAQVSTAIVEANQLIGSRVIPPLGTGFLSPSTTSALETILDNFNNGLSGPPHCN